MMKNSFDEAAHPTEPHILVVEDNPAMNAAICDILSFNQFQVFSASNGQTGLEMLQKHRPDLVLCDIMMPVMDGYTLLKNTRADPHLRTVPFIFLTARTSAEDRRAAKSIGIEDYLTKPFDPDDLLLSVANALRRSRSVAEESQRQMDAMRSQIIAILQHEFRTPLTLVLGYAELILEAADANLDMEEMKSSVRAILEGGQRLQNLIESFLMLADLQNRTGFEGDLSLIRVGDLVDTVVSRSQSRVLEAGLRLEVYPDNSDTKIYGSWPHLENAIKRILDNALQYTRPESHTIWISTPVGNGYTGINITDEGVGMDPDLLAQLARPFEQIDRDNREQSGAGLSLALIRNIARLHGGELTIESVVGQGSSFTLWIPEAPNQ